MARPAPTGAAIEALAETRGASAKRGKVLPSIGGAPLAAVGILSYGLLGYPGPIKARLFLAGGGSLLLSCRPPCRAAAVRRRSCACSGSAADRRRPRA